MDVKNFLAGVGAGIEDNPITRGADLLGCRDGPGFG